MATCITSNNGSSDSLNLKSHLSLTIIDRLSVKTASGKLISTEMGIEGLSKLIETKCPNAIQKHNFKHYRMAGRKIAISANIFLNKFLRASKSDEDTTETLRGLFYHAVGVIESGIKPVYVFHGDPHVDKIVGKRTEESPDQSSTAKESGSLQDSFKKVDSVHTEGAKKLLELMGIPIVQAPGKAEAQCAALQKAGKVFAVATEDMDTLLYGAKIVIRDFTITKSKDKSMMEFNLDKVLEGLDFSMDKFIDMCILIGCDYCVKIPKIGGKAAIELIGKHGSVQEIRNQISEGNLKYKVPDEFNHQHAQKVYKNPTVEETFEINWHKPIDEEGIVSYLCSEMGMNKKSIQNGIKKLKDARKKFQHSIDSFFSKRRSSGSQEKNQNTVGAKKSRIEEVQRKEEEYQDGAGPSGIKK